MILNTFSGKTLKKLQLITRIELKGQNSYIGQSVKKVVQCIVRPSFFNSLCKNKERVIPKSY